MLRSRLTQYAYGVHEREALQFDRHRQIDTAGEIPVSNLGIPSEVAAHARPYAGSPPRLLKTLLPKVAPFPQRTSFVDLGSGKGRTLLVAAELGFQQCIGVEFSAALHEQAHANLERVSSHSNLNERVRLVQGDASQFAFPAGPLVVFFNNPFQGEVMESVLHNLAATTRSGTGPIHLIYQSVHGASIESGTAANLRLFDEQAFLRPVSPRIWNPRVRLLLDPFILRIYRAITSRG